MHTTPGKNVVSIKGGCIEGLRWQDAKHIWTKNALVPIPEGVETCEEEPDEAEDQGIIACGEKKWSEIWGKPANKDEMAEQGGVEGSLAG